MKIFLNPGHAPGVDSGAVNLQMGLKECDIALAVGKVVKEYLEAVGYEVMSMQTDNLAGENPKYENVTATANEWQADLFVSLHCNAYNGLARGIETFCYNLDGDGGILAMCIQNQLVATLQEIDPNIPDRGVKRDVRGLAVLRATSMPAVLIEMAFIDQGDDVRILVDRQDDIARAIARGVSDFYI